VQRNEVFLKMVREKLADVNCEVKTTEFIELQLFLRDILKLLIRELLRQKNSLKKFSLARLEIFKSLKNLKFDLATNIIFV
jgi:hypothetical protein